MSDFIETIKNEAGETLGIIIRNDFQEEGVKFCTPNDFSQQLAYMKHPKGKVIQPHIHNKIERKVHLTQEVLIIKTGKLRVDFYSQEMVYQESRILTNGDVILLANGGHGFEVLEPSEFYEVKQGPYVGEMDKVRFESTDKEKIRFPNHLEEKRC